VSADRNLLFGILALQNGFVTRDQLMEAMNAWVIARHLPLGDLLRERGALAQEEHALLEALVSRQLARHQGDAEKSLLALDVSPSARDALAAVPDAGVQASLASLAPGQETAPPGSSTAWPRTVAPAAVPPPPSPGLRYRRLRPHAKGGLGEVYVALDEELRREVALKEIQARYADDPDARTRFVREAEVTGNLEHPGVVPVYGLGQYADGRPLYAMRFIRGESMQDAVARFHQADARPGRDRGERSLALRDLLGRFVAVCQAVGYAHARGVVHRDLKPANVMLGEFGETLVVDWGLARAFDQPDGERTTAERPLAFSGDGSAPTQLGQVVGTPAFMPPEQANGQLDRLGPASDVFSLGATLYCLLTGQPPYAGADVLVQAAMAEAAPARRRNPAVPPALEAVCARAMAARPQDRYPTALALAADVERWLADEPVGAYREPALARATRWARKHRTLVGTAASGLLVALAALAVGLAVVGGLNQRLEAANAKLEKSNAKLVGLLTEVVGADHPSPLTTRHGLAELYRDQGKYEKAEPLYLELLRLREKVLGADHPYTLDAKNNLAVLYRDQGKYEKAEPLYLEVLRLREKVQGADHRSTLSAKNNLAELYRAQGKHEKAEQLYLEVLILQEKVLGADHPSTLTTKHGLAVLYERWGKPERAEPLRRQRLDFDRGKAGADSPTTAGAMAYLGLNLLQQKKHAEAEKLLRDCLRILQKAQPDDWTTFLTRSLLGEVLLGQGKHAEAEPLLLQGYEGVKRHEAKIPPQVRPVRLKEALGRLVRLYEATGKKDEAAKWQKKLDEVKKAATPQAPKK
jgi:serine/threonine protein kinase